MPDPRSLLPDPRVQEFQHLPDGRHLGLPMLYFRAAATDEGHGRAGHGNFREMTRRARVPWESLFEEDATGT